MSHFAAVNRLAAAGWPAGGWLAGCWLAKISFYSCCMGFAIDTFWYLL
jgi:hypothetical protein